MQRELNSHKGENGKVAVIGGSKEIHGAPLLSALAAEASGVDLVFVAVPAVHAEVAKMTSLNFQVRSFEKDDLTSDDVDALHEWLATMDACVIGPGIARGKKNLEALEELIAGCPCPMVLDASALQPWTLDAARDHLAILTPHLGELERMEIDPSRVAEATSSSNQVIHVKGAVDRIALPDGSIAEVSGGNPLLTVGGTGDVLAGLTAGFLAQRVPREQASIQATKIIKRAAEILSDERRSITARNVIAMIPLLLNQF